MREGGPLQSFRTMRTKMVEIEFLEKSETVMAATGAVLGQGGGVARGVATEKGAEVPEDHPKINKRIQHLRSYAEAPVDPCGDKNIQNYKKKR